MKNQEKIPYWIIHKPNIEKSRIDTIYRQEMKEDIQKAMEITLTEPEQDIIKEYFVKKARLASIAKQKNLTSKHICNRQHKENHQWAKLKES